MVTYLIGLLTLANVFIAIFIFLYSWHFLKETVRQKSRHPWELLFLASTFYLAFQLTSLATVYGFNSVDTENVQMLLEFLFSGIVLYTFLTQHDLIHHYKKIVIRRKSRSSL